MRVLNTCFIVLFMAMLLIPLIFVDLEADRVSVQENRMFAERPRIADIKNHPGKFKKEFDAWFKDSTGFREQLIKVHGILDNNRWINGVRYTDGQYTYLVGEQGHHYFAHENGRLIQIFQGKKYFSDEKLIQLAGKIKETKTYLDSRGIPFIVMVCTDKVSIYPEYYPKSIKRGSEPIQIDRITRYLQENTSADVFNIRQALLAEKNNYMLYSVIDVRWASDYYAHYNQLGAFFAYRELMRHINVYFPDIKPFEIDDVDITYDKKEQPSVILRETAYKKRDPSFFDDVNLIRPFSWENSAFENVEQDLPVILFLSDSYSHEMYFGKYIAQHFGTTIQIHYYNIANFNEYLEKYNPDIVVFETVEYNIELFANSVLQIPELLQNN